MRTALLASASVAVCIALLFARPHPTPGPPMRDFEAYYAAGHAWNAGADPYSQAIWRAEGALPGVSRPYEALPFVAPPATLPLFGAIARMPFGVANTLWRTLLLLFLAALALLALKLAQRRLTPESFLAIAIAVLGFGPATSALALGQLALPADVFAALALSAPPAALIAWIQPNVGLVLISQALTRRGAAAFAAGIAAFGGLCALAVGIPGLEQYAQVVHQHSLAERYSAIQITPAAVAYGFGASPALALSIGSVIAVAAVCCWVLLLRRVHDAVARFCGTCALLPLAVPFFHEHDLLVVFIPAVVLAVRADSRVWAPAAFGALLAGTDWLGLAQRPDGTLQTVLLIGALGAALVVLRDRPQKRMLLVPCAVLALIGVASAFAHAHPLPVWPDAMGPLPPNVEHLDIASAWNAEQRATGLVAHQPLWAGLRLLSLLGCAVTAAAIALSSKSAARSKSPSPAPA